MKVINNISQLVTLESSHKKDGRNLDPEDLSLIEQASIAYDQNEIKWIGKTIDLPEEYKNFRAVDGSNYTITPEIVESHTHLVFGGDRSFEYSLRLNGADYEEIAKAGGGIKSTVSMTQKESEDELFSKAVERIQRISTYGVGTIEIKSGYGLDYITEKKITRVIDRLKKEFKDDIQIFNTYLAAHAIPDKYKTGMEYLKDIVIPLMKEEKDIIDAVDIFQEEGYFNYEETELLFNKAKDLGLNIKIHADEFNDNKGASLAVKFGALSADHLLQTSDEGIKLLAQSKTVATILPGTALFLGKPLAPARKMLDQGVKLAIASDYNPGSCHCDNLLLIASICAKNLKMNIAEVWSAITLNSAHALGLYNQGALIKGMNPRFSVFKVKTLDQITYSWGRNFSIKI